MKFIPNAISSTIGKAAFKTQNASPGLLFGAGLVGMGATVVLACRATLKVDDILVDAQKDLANIDAVVKTGRDNYDVDDAKRDTVHVYVRTSAKILKQYSPAIACAVFTVACLTKSHRTLTSRNAALVAAYSTVAETLEKYRDRIRGEIGEDREREIYHDMTDVAKITDDKGKTKTIKVPNGDAEVSMYARFFSKQSSSSFSVDPHYNLMFIRSIQNYANDLLTSRGHVLLNDVYDSLGLERSTAGAIVGWLKDGEGDGYISFGVLDGEHPDRFYDFMVGNEGELLLDFNVDGVIYKAI